MDLKAHAQPKVLEQYAFFWLLLLLVFSAAALFLGARPPLLLLIGYSAWGILKFFWLASGAATAYLFYRWNEKGKLVFGGHDNKDRIAFWFMMLTGLNVGLSGLVDINIYLGIFFSKLFYGFTGVACVVAAYHLYNRYIENGRELFVTIKHSPLEGNSTVADEQAK